VEKSIRAAACPEFLSDSSAEARSRDASPACLDVFRGSAAILAALDGILPASRNAPFSVISMIGIRHGILLRNNSVSRQEKERVPSSERLT
jgi:hypothetical protein